MKYFFSLLSIISFLLLNGCGNKSSDETTAKHGEANTNRTQATTVGEYISVEEKTSDIVPNFHWKDAQGNTMDLNSFTEKITLVNFWATWCGPCKMETPDLIEVEKLMQNNGVKFLGISADTGPSAKEDVQEFAKKFNIPYQMIVDRDDELQDAFGNVRAYPTTFLVNKERKIVAQWIGVRSKQGFIDEIQKILQ